MKAYSYLRFSSEIQKKGDSLRRQTELALNWCKANNVELDETSYQDLGISAYKGANLVEGKLGLFLDSVAAGKIPRDSYLLVESLDRVSRQEILTALSTLTKILNEGITLITLTDNKVYTKESLNNLPDLMYSILIMSRANEESLQKSKRIQAAWDNKHKLARETNKPITHRIPAWLRLVDGQFVVLEDRAEIVRTIFRLALTMGQHSIVKWLNENKIPTFGDGEKELRKGEGWQHSYINKLFNDKKVIGTYTPRGKEPIENYYPKIIDDDLYNNTIHAVRGRQSKGGRPTSKVNIFQGLLKCGKCGASIARLNKGYGVQLWCDRNRRGLSNEPSCKGWLSLDSVESSILKNIKEMDINTIISNDETEEQRIAYKITSLVNQKDTIYRQLNTLTEALLIGGEISVLVNKLKELESNKVAIEAELEEHGRLLEKVNQHKRSLQNDIDIVESLLKSDDESVRLKARYSIRNIIEKIRLHLKSGNINVCYKNVSTEFSIKTKDRYIIKGKSVALIESDGELEDDPISDDYTH
jgi:DNA invertase Pin-like site-specific DNA recombinase